MGFYSESIHLPESIFLLLRELIHERTGLIYDDDKRDLLADKLAPMVLERGFQSALDYYYLLKYDPEADVEWRRVMNVLSVPETYFWREIDQIQALVDIVVPNYFANNSGILRINVAACASGEEPLTIAMALNEAGWFERSPIEIFACDASETVLQRARRGLYRERAFRTLPAHLREKYFHAEEGGWQIDTQIHRRVSWARVNLMSDSDVAQLPSATVFFCRNLFIYFSTDAIRKTVSSFSQRMPKGGYLFIGASESLLRVVNDFDLQEIGSAFVYVKKS
jgi:chemotaxis protein methyltransferase CheR